MRFCVHCGKEITDGAVICTGCGCPVTEPEPVRKTGGRPNFALIIVLGAVAVVAAVLAILFLPRDLEMKDFKQTNVVTAIMRYGVPEEIDTTEELGICLRYGEKVTFYGYAGLLTVCPEEDKVTFLFGSDEASEVYKKIERYCIFEGGVYLHTFRYGDLKITTSPYESHYVIIEIN